MKWMKRKDMVERVLRIADARGIDLTMDSLPAGAVPRYDRTPGGPVRCHGTDEVPDKGSVFVPMHPGAPDDAVVEAFLDAEPRLDYYCLPYRVVGDDVVEWGLVACS